MFFYWIFDWKFDWKFDWIFHKFLLKNRLKIQRLKMMNSRLNFGHAVFSIENFNLDWNFSIWDALGYDQFLVCIFSCLNMQIHTWILVCLSFKGDDRQQLGLGESKQQASHKPCAQEGRSTSSTWRLVWKQERTGWKHNHGRRSQFGGLVYIEVD